LVAIVVGVGLAVLTTRDIAGALTAMTEKRKPLRRYSSWQYS
jgi:hypothetical protein